jgi:hypothetical protein
LERRGDGSDGIALPVKRFYRINRAGRERQALKWCRVFGTKSR